MGLFQYILLFKYPTVLQALLYSKDLDLSLRWEGMTAVMLAERNGHKKVAEIIQTEAETRALNPHLYPQSCWTQVSQSEHREESSKSNIPGTRAHTPKEKKKPAGNINSSLETESDDCEEPAASWRYKRFSFHRDRGID